ncbi:AMP-binding protein [Nocardia sp. NPDC127579]|uniref:AMP-binding protein n=1 Tax=Nocardia sp. NPDC127579 TaxID=3345402 RepID=UPI003626EFF6
MVTEIIEHVYELPVGRRALWRALTDPMTYSRLFGGIGGCEYVAGGDSPLLLFRIGADSCGIRDVRVRLIVGRRHEKLELYCPDPGSLAAIRLRGQNHETSVVVTIFAPGRVHPAIARATNTAVIAWVGDGLRRVAERCRKAPSSVVEGEATTVPRRQIAVAAQLIATGVVRPHRVGLGVKQLVQLGKWGLGLAGGYAAAAACAPTRPAVVCGPHTRDFAALHARTDSIARALTDAGLDGRHTAAVLARNHVGMIEVMVAACKAGMDLVLLNGGMAGRQVEAITQRERLSAVFVESEFVETVRYLPDDVLRIGIGSVADCTSIDGLAERDPGTAARPARTGRMIVLTSGTSGSPKCARRPHPRSLDAVASVLSEIPMAMEETILIASPLFHTWGLGMLQLSTALRATVVLEPRFDAEQCLRTIADQRVDTLVVVPTMVQRLIELAPEIRSRYDTSSLRVVACGGAPLSGATALRFLDIFGDILYNVYGSTEVSWATIATPQDLRCAPATVGRPPVGTRIAVLGPDLRPVPVGAVGRVFVANQLLFDGYVNAPPPMVADGMLDTGDNGYVDVAGRLFLTGRSDEMVISGGEKFFPRPVQEALEYLPQVREAAVVGVPDPDFGQRLAAFVVTREGAGLDAQMIRDYLRHRLGRVAVPRDVSFLSALPRGATGKVIPRFLTVPDARTR